MIVGGKLYYQENAANFQKTLKEAIAAYGIPNKLYVYRAIEYFYQYYRKKFPNLKKDMLINKQGDYRTPNYLDRKKK